MDQNSTPATLEERVAEIEGKIASSWALRTRAEYEAEFRDRVKQEILTYTIKVVISALVLLTGAGYVFIKSANTEAYQSQNKQIIADLKAKYDANLAEEKIRFEWKRQHDYGKNYVYLADFYWNSDITDQKKKRALVEEQVSRSKTYFSYAMRCDPQQPTTYWELGELNYTYPKKWSRPELVDATKAIYYYKLAAKLYPDFDILRGWRADAYRMIAKIELENAKTTNKKEEATKARSNAQEYLEKARDEYSNAIPESREYNKNNLAEVDEMRMELSKGIRNK